MKGKTKDLSQTHLFEAQLVDLVDPKHKLCKLASKIPWDSLESELAELYSHTGQPSKPVRLMVSLLLLKQMYNLSDEAVVERWVENPYYQHFSGEAVFRWSFPCHPTDLVRFRHRLGESGVKRILAMSIALHGQKALEKEVVFDTTVQEKNITFPTDAKQYRKIIHHCGKIAGAEGVKQRQSYRRVVKKLALDLRFANHPKKRKKAARAQRKLRTIAGRLVRELDRKLSGPAKQNYSKQLDIYRAVLAQGRKSKNKIYSLHEPEVYCMSKGKEHKKYEFGSKASLAYTKTSGIIVGALNFAENTFDGHTLEGALAQMERLTGRRPDVAICDRGYRGKSKYGDTIRVIPKPPGKKDTAYQKTKARKRFRRRAAIEPVIGHLKSDHRLKRNYLKGVVGDAINLMLAAAAFNLKKWMRMTRAFFCSFILNCIKMIQIPKLKTKPI
jgi:IS5 family transposase